MIELEEFTPTERHRDILASAQRVRRRVNRDVDVVRFAMPMPTMYPLGDSVDLSKTTKYIGEVCYAPLVWDGRDKADALKISYQGETFWATARGDFLRLAE